MSSPKPIELVYKHVDGLDISMDVYLPSDESKTDLPVVLWWHGGGLIQGTRKAITPHLYLAPERHNICVVSADYRLAPQSRFPAILSDCASAVSFIASSSEFRNATKGRVDGTKIVVSGSSAGGWLALLAGTGIGYAACGVESPAALIAGVAAIYPITDLLDPFWTEKKTNGVNYFDRVIGHDEVAQYVDPSSVKTCLSASDSPRSIFYTYMVQE
ncbi:hypothetical protein ONZ45_g10352 [Pleurotus djamor]|nr:hypothetical protein ONZ45_g10352 [Pleurotus djamor]